MLSCRCPSLRMHCCRWTRMTVIRCWRATPNWNCRWTIGSTASQRMTCCYPSCSGWSLRTETNCSANSRCWIERKGCWPSYCSIHSIGMTGWNCSSGKTRCCWSSGYSNYDCWNWTIGMSCCSTNWIVSYCCLTTNSNWNSSCCHCCWSWTIGWSWRSCSKNYSTRRSGCSSCCWPYYYCCWTNRAGQSEASQCVRPSTPQWENHVPISTEPTASGRPRACRS